LPQPTSDTPRESGQEQLPGPGNGAFPSLAGVVACVLGMVNVGLVALGGSGRVNQPYGYWLALLVAVIELGCLATVIRRRGPLTVLKLVFGGGIVLLVTGLALTVELLLFYRQTG
jgi:hypothetical protein